MGGNDVFAGLASDAAKGTLAGSGAGDVFAGLGAAVHASIASIEGHDTAAIAGWQIVAALGVTGHARYAGRPRAASRRPASMAGTRGSDVLAGPPAVSGDGLDRLTDGRRRLRRLGRPARSRRTRW